MVTIPELIKILKLENRLVHDQTRDLTHADTLIQPKPSGNCMNWVLGHLLDTLIEILQVLGGESPITSEHLERYTRESEPITGDGKEVVKLDELLDGHDLVHEAIVARLGELSEKDFETEIVVGEKSVVRGWRVFFLHFHYTYHIGQLELLRQLAGKADKVI